MIKQRDSYLDNAKFILMVLVVFTHFFTGMTEKRGIYEDLYYFLFTIHMPTFILISGYFSKNVFKDWKWLKKARHFLWLYLLFQVTFSVFYYKSGLDKTFDLDFSVPEWSLWFLLAMSFWYIGLFLLRRLPWWLTVPFSIIMAIFIGYVPEVGREFSMQRTFVFFPYFVIGYYLPSHFFTVLKKRKMRYLGIIVLLLLFIYVIKIDNANKYWFFGSKAYNDFMDFPEFGALVRILFYSLSVFGVCGFLTIVPQKNMWFTKFGRNTLNVYLFQGFIIKVIREYVEFDGLSFMSSIIFFSICSVILTVFFASNWFNSIAKRLLNAF